MIEARALVLSAAAGRARVRVLDREEGCGRCDQPGGCRSVKLAYAIRPARSEFDVPDEIGVAPGDEVVLRMPDGAALRGALAGYGLGAALLLLGALAGLAAGGGDAAAVAGAACGLLLAFVLNRVLHRSRHWRGLLRVQMLPAGTLRVHDFPEPR
jgi:sigma-E factor negative regulatory protein RseC